MGIIILTLERGIKADTPDRSIHVVRHHSCWSTTAAKKAPPFPSSAYKNAGLLALSNIVPSN